MGRRSGEAPPLLTPLAVLRVLIPGQVRDPKEADVVDLGIAHDGYPPRVVAYSGNRVVMELEARRAPRQIENLRVVARKIDRLVMTAEGDAVLNYVRTELPDTSGAKKRRPASTT
jgi:hypothetical protein